MKIVEIKCPDCESIGKMSLTQMMFEGPYRCWKCRSLFTIVIANDRLQSCEPLSQEDFDKWQESQQGADSS